MVRPQALWLTSLGLCSGATWSFTLPSNRRYPVWGQQRAVRRATAVPDIDEKSSVVKNDTNETIILADSGDFVKPQRDLRQYRAIILPNNLQVLLVSDQMETGQVGVEAASVHVQAGHMDDTIPGLA